MFRLLLISLTLVLLAAGGPGKPAPPKPSWQQPPAAQHSEECCGPRPCPPMCGDEG